jgi:hypothetical protein
MQATSAGPSIRHTWDCQRLAAPAGAQGVWLADRAGIAHARGMQRGVALALCAALAAQPGCAHQQLTNQEFALGVVTVAVIVGALVVLSMAIDCDRNGPCTHPPSP